MFLDPSCLLAQTSLVHLRSHDLQQVKSVINTSCRKALNLLRCLWRSSFFFGGGCNRTRTSRLTGRVFVFFWLPLALVSSQPRRQPLPQLAAVAFSALRASSAFRLSSFSSLVPRPPFAPSSHSLVSFFSYIFMNQHWRVFLASTVNGPFQPALIPSSWPRSLLS